MTSPRVYTYGINYDGSKEFLHTHLDKTSALKYCKDHAKVFKYRFKEYRYGSMGNEQDNWEVFTDG